MRLKECGWEDQLRLHAKDVVREKGLERIKLEELTKEITPKDFQVDIAWLRKSPVSIPNSKTNSN